MLTAKGALQLQRAPHSAAIYHVPMPTVSHRPSKEKREGAVMLSKRQRYPFEGRTQSTPEEDQRNSVTKKKTHSFCRKRKNLHPLQASQPALQD